jgi:hypothetical protein
VIPSFAVVGLPARFHPVPSSLSFQRPSLTFTGAFIPLSWRTSLPRAAGTRSTEGRFWSLKRVVMSPKGYFDMGILRFT